MDRYSKFIFMSTPRSAPSSAPSAAPSVDAGLAARQKKAAELAKKKKDRNDKLKGTTATITSEQERVWQAWLNNNQKGNETIPAEDPQYLALNWIKDSADRERAFVLLGIVIKFMGGKSVAMDLLKKSFNKDRTKFDLNVIRAHFSKEKCRDSNQSVGFYYGPRTIIWNPDWGFGELHDAEAAANKRKYMKASVIMDPNKSRSRAIKLTITGWWAWDKGEDNDNYYDNNSNNVDSGVLKYLRRGGHGDEWCGPDIMTALNGKHKTLNKELKNRNQRASLPADERDDSGLDPEREENIKKELNRLKDIPGTTYNSKSRKEVLKWFKAGRADKWVKLDENIIKNMALVFGVDTGKFKYRYVPEKNKIFFMRIDKTQIPSNYAKFGYLTINKDGTLDSKWNELKEDAFKAMILKDFLGSMTPTEIKTELKLHEAATAKDPSKEASLAATKGKLHSLIKKKTIKYSELNNEYYENIEKRLKEKLEKDPNTKNNAAILATKRIEQFKADVNAYLNKPENSEFKQKLEDSPDTVITVKVDSDDKVTITSRDSKIDALRGKVTGAASLALDTGKNMRDAVEAEYKRIMSKAGFLGSILGWFTNIKEDIKEYLKPGGKKGMILGLLMMITGAKISKRMLSAVPIENLSQMQKLARLNGGRLASDIRIKSPQELTGLKIEIPKGKGIIPGGKFRVKVEGIAGTQEVSPERARAAAEAKAKAEGGEKKGGMLSGLFGGIGKMFGGLFGGGKGKNNDTAPMFADKKITVEPKTTLPAGTYIPKGSKISVA